MVSRDYHLYGHYDLYICILVLDSRMANSYVIFQNYFKLFLLYAVTELEI
jgi:hypothetical protein